MRAGPQPGARIKGAVLNVAQLITSAHPAAPSKSSTRPASKPSARSTATKASARAAVGFQTSTRPIGRTARCAAGSKLATRPAPTSNNRPASARARNDAASADAAAVRRAVNVSPSTSIAGCPVSAWLSR